MAEIKGAKASAAGQDCFWQPVNPIEQAVIDVGKTVAKNQKLVFVRVEKGWSQIVPGCGVNYDLIIVATEDIRPPPPSHLYAFVFLRAVAGSGNGDQLVSFEQLAREPTA